MKHKTFTRTKAPLPTEEKSVGGEFCEKTASQRKVIIKKTLKK